MKTSALVVLMIAVFVLTGAMINSKTSQTVNYEATDMALMMFDVSIESRVAVLEYTNDARATLTPIATDWDLATLVTTFTWETPIWEDTVEYPDGMTRTPLTYVPRTPIPTNTPRPLPPTPTPSDGTVVSATNISDVSIRIRWCPEVSSACGQVAVLRPNETLLLNTLRKHVSSGYIWYELADGSGWITIGTENGTDRWLTW